MAVIPRSQRTNLPPGGSQLPGPSIVRINTATAKDRGIANVGQTLQQIGVMAQRTNDNAEFEKAIIQQQSDINSIVATNTASISDPNIFQAQTTKDIEKAFTASGKTVNFRNKNRFSIANKRIKANANVQINSQFYKKTVDRSNAQYTVSSSELLNKFLDGSMSKDEAVNTASALMADRLNNGVWDKGRWFKETLDFNGKIEKLDFVRTYEPDPQKAVDTINNSKFLTTEQKTDFLFKMASKIDKAEKKNNLVFESKAKINISKYDDLSLHGNLEEGFVSEDGLTLETFNRDVNNGTISPTDARRIRGQQQDVFDAGGIGDERAMNQIKSTIYEDFTITVDTVNNNKSLNFPQKIELKQAIKSRDNAALNSPAAGISRKAIRAAHKATGIFQGAMLSDEIATHLKNQLDVYNGLLEDGDSPESAFLQSQKITGPVPGSTEVSEAMVIRREAELEKFMTEVAKRNEKSKGKLAKGEGKYETEYEDIEFQRKRMEKNIASLKEQLSVKLFLEERNKNAGIGK